MLRRNLWSTTPHIKLHARSSCQRTSTLRRSCCVGPTGYAPPSPHSELETFVRKFGTNPVAASVSTRRVCGVGAVAGYVVTKRWQCVQRGEGDRARGLSCGPEGPAARAASGAQSGAAHAARPGHREGAVCAAVKIARLVMHYVYSWHVVTDAEATRGRVCRTPVSCGSQPSVSWGTCDCAKCCVLPPSARGRGAAQAGSVRSNQ